MTNVIWDIAELGTLDLIPGEVWQMDYAAAIPMNANALFATPPTPASLLQAANVDNNTGSSTQETLAEQVFQNYVLLTGDYKVSAERAETLGLVNRVVAAEELAAAALSFAEQLADNDLTAVRLTKQAINRSYQIMGMPQALAEALEFDVTIESTATETKQDQQ